MIRNINKLKNKIKSKLKFIIQHIILNKTKTMNETIKVLNLYFPTDISKIILQMADHAEHAEKYENVFNDLKIDQLHRIYHELQETITYKSTLREYSVNNICITQLQPDINVNEFVLNRMSQYATIANTLHILSKCECCPRHKENKPITVHANPDTYLTTLDESKNTFNPGLSRDKNRFNKNGEVYYCMCSCRKLARMMMLAYKSHFDLKSAYYRRTLLYNYKQSKDKNDYYTTELEKLRSNPQSQKRKRKTYMKMNILKEKIREIQHNLKYDISYLQYHMTMYPNIEKETKYQQLYNEIPMKNIHIHQH